MCSPAERVCRLLIIAVLLAGCLAVPRTAWCQIRAEAFVGEPFGVGRVEIDLPGQMMPEVLGADGIVLTEKDGRVFYPVGSQQMVRGLFRSLLERPQVVTVYFLFQGSGLLEVTVGTQTAETVGIAPTIDPIAYDRLRDAWWAAYTAGRLGFLEKGPDYPPIVENYLRSMLAPRLGLQLPKDGNQDSWQTQVKKQIGLAMGTESIRIAIQRERMLGRAGVDERPELPLPTAAATSPMVTPEPDPNIEVDPIAIRVPVECLYVRFGSFSNFLWSQDTLQQWGGDLKNLISSRGLNQDLAGKIENQLVLRQTALAKLLGDTVVADAAIIGTDLFFQEGGAFGIVLHARKNNPFLAGDIKRQRLEKMLKDKSVTDETVLLAGREVSMLSSPDGSVRSFWVADGDFHFVTTSKTLARRFVECASGEGTLGNSREFCHARTLMPLERKDTVFVYLSAAFFQNIISPHYRVESARRMQALADVELVELAVLAAAAEGKPGESIEQLIAGGFLPPGFGPRTDGSYAVLDGGDVYDSLRGRRGVFLPIPDVPVTRVSRSELEAYREFVDYYHSKWGRLDPVLVGIKRHAQANNRDRIVIDARMSPFAVENFQRLQQYVGPPDKLQLAPVAGDQIAFDILFPKHRIFGGIQDFRPPVQFIGGLILPVGQLTSMVVGYIGSTGELGLLSVLESLIMPRLSGIAGLSGIPGLSDLLPRMQPRNSGQFSVFSFQPELMQAVIPQLRFEEAERPAQLRLRVEDISAGRMAGMLNNVGYARTRDTSLGNIRLMESLAQQFHLPGEHCKDAAELLLGAQLVCPLGGEYVYRRTPGGVGFWTSTELIPGQSGSLFSTRAPAGYRAPPMNWFRGLKLDGMVTQEILSAHVEIIMQKPEKVGKSD